MNGQVHHSSPYGYEWQAKSSSLFGHFFWTTFAPSPKQDVGKKARIVYATFYKGSFYFKGDGYGGGKESRLINHRYA